MSIRRSPRVDTGFYILNKAISEDERLSWAARGMLVFLLGKPDNWVVSVQHLVNQTEKAIGRQSGRDAVRAVINELREAGYLQRDVQRDECGQIAGVEYVLHETPQTPETDNPASVNPSPANPPLTRNDLLTSIETSPSATASQPGEVSSTVKPECPVSDIVALYNEILAHQLPEVVLVNAGRRKAVTARWNEHKRCREMSFWVEYFEKVERSDFLMGKTQSRPGQKPFEATFDWLMCPSNFVKVIEGNYDNKTESTR